MINFDIAQCKEVFSQYVSDYDIKNERIRLKVVHTFKVLEVMEWLCEAENVTGDCRELARLVALLHDFGRFEQLRRFDSFIDGQTVDHAELGADLLFKEGYIKEFAPKESGKVYEVIETAIRWHNKFKIPEELGGSVRQICQLIRDADKLDIFRVINEESIEALEGCSAEAVGESLITEEIYKDILDGLTVLSAKRKTPMDHWVSHLALVNDLVFNSSKEWLKESGLLAEIAGRIDYKHPETKAQIQSLLQYLEA